MNTVDAVMIAAEQALRERRVEEAIRLFDQAEIAGADRNRCDAGRWTVHVLNADFDQAWLRSDSIRSRRAHDPHRLWDGDPLNGKRVMVRCLHGFGDAVQLLRYIPQLLEITAYVVVQVAPRFLDLATWFDGVTNVITWESESAPEPEWDSQIEIMELPYIFRTQVNDLPIAINYLRPPFRPGPAITRPTQILQVGMVWTAGEWNMSRSVQFLFLRPLFEVKGCAFWNLQPCTSRYEQPALLEDENCHDTITGLAERIAQLDLVITVDTLAAHVAGAMNVPTWLMLQHEADWRWMTGRHDSPWYPSMRLFRQPTAGDWDSVITSVTQALRNLASDQVSPEMVA